MMRVRGVVMVAMVTYAAAGLLAGNRPAHAQTGPAKRPGKVLIIRGTLSVFSLGMDTLGDTLQGYGLEVEVVPAFSASSAAARLGDEYLRRADARPIVIVGHSRGGQLAPQCARELQARRIPVKLVVIVDNPNETTVPANVARCVNFYHTNMFGLFHGLPTRAEDRRTQVVNADIDRLPNRNQEGYIDHFNMDASPWIHSMIVAEVLRACPAVPAEARAKGRQQQKAATSTPRDTKARR